jgi:hypothetical protein
MWRAFAFPVNRLRDLTLPFSKMKHDGVVSFAQALVLPLD